MDAPARILLVDDSSFDRELAILMLRGLATPFTIREAASWEEARGLVDGEGIDLLLST
jgi:CheY-like chemotaxis protein